VKYVNLGSAGLRVSRICLGMMSYGDNTDRAWAQGEDVAEPIVRAAVDGGVTFFDTADAYNGGTSEVITGRLLAKMFPSRDDYVLATKVYFPTGAGENDRGLSRKHILSAIDASLRRLGTGCVDLYQIHRWDPGTPAEEAMQALNDVVRAGKARYVGASSMFAWQFAKAQYTAQRNGWSSFSSMQDHYNLIYREEEREMIPQCLDQGVAVLPWSPLARGLLAGSRTRAGEQRTTRAGSDPFWIRCTTTRPTSTWSSGWPRSQPGAAWPPAQVALAASAPTTSCTSSCSAIPGCSSPADLPVTKRPDQYYRYPLSIRVNAYAKTRDSTGHRALKRVLAMRGHRHGTATTREAPPHEPGL
jgi:1-deoxyxylulose-5-phosphate synthase